MVETIRFCKDHLNDLEKFHNMVSIADKLTPQVLANMEQRSHSYTVVEGSKVLGCAGVTEYYQGRGEAWAFIDKNIKQDFIKFHNQVRLFLDRVEIKRVEATVDVGFEDGVRWVKALGFIMEAPLMKNFGRSGEDCMLFSRVRGE